MKWIDTHCHLDVSPLSDDLDNVLLRSAAAGVDTIVAVAYDLASWPKVTRLGMRPGILPAIGLHPWKAEEPLEKTALVEALKRVNAVAIGEIGLDLKMPVPKDRQVQVFRLQLEVARERDLPVLLHCRGAFEEMLAILQDFGAPLRGIIHAFSRGPDLAHRFAEVGLHVAFGGAITHENAHRARQAVRSLALEQIVLETDAPSIALAGIPAEKVEPAHVAIVGQTLAQLKGISAEQTAAVTTANAQTLLRRSCEPRQCVSSLEK
jgi:TatD DNase family protein